MNNVNSPLIVPDLRNEAVLVASDVEDGALSDRVGVGEITPRSGQGRPFGMFGDPVPVLERLPGIGMLFPELAQRLPADNSHASYPSELMLSN
jgi:hypothetical protein